MQSKDPLSIALNYLRYRWRTVFEIRTKLQEKDIAEPEIQKTIDSLIEYQLLDDRRFAQSWIRQRSLLRPSGHYRLRQELKKLGISEDIISEAFQAVSEKDTEVTDEFQLALEAGHRKLSTYRSLPEDTFRRRMLGFLQRRGFSYAVSKKVLAVLEEER